LGPTIAALDGAASIVLAPFYVATARQRPALAAVMLAGAIVQILALVGSVRPAKSLADPFGVVTIALSRLLTSPLGDRLGYHLLIPRSLALLVIAGVAVALWYARSSLPARTVLVLSWAALALALLGTVSEVNSVADLAAPTDQGRYITVGAWAIFAIATAAFASGRRSGAFLIACLVVGLASTARITPVTGPDWVCIGGAEPCTAASVVWPGAGGSYRLPVGVQAQGWIHPK
jgi:hypothetical protein